MNYEAINSKFPFVLKCRQAVEPLSVLRLSDTCCATAGASAAQGDVF